MRRSASRSGSPLRSEASSHSPPPNTATTTIANAASTPVTSLGCWTRARCHCRLNSAILVWGKFTALWAATGEPVEQRRIAVAFALQPRVPQKDDGRGTYCRCAIAYTVHGRRRPPHCRSDRLRHARSTCAARRGHPARKPHTRDRSLRKRSERRGRQVLARPGRRAVRGTLARNRAPPPGLPEELSTPDVGAAHAVQ